MRCCSLLPSHQLWNCVLICLFCHWSLVDAVLSFCVIIDLFYNCFLSCYARDAGFSHMYTVSWKQYLLCSVKTLMAITSILVTQHYLFFFVFFLFFFCFVFVLFFFFWVLTCSGLSHLPNGLFYFFLVNKRFQAEKAFNYKQPQVLGWWLLNHARKPIAYFSKYQKKAKSHSQSLLTEKLILIQ